MFKLRKFASTLGGITVVLAVTMSVASCSQEPAQPADGFTENLDMPTVVETPLDIANITENVRTSGSDLVVSAGWFDCHQETPTTCTGEQPVGPAENDAFDDSYDEYSTACQEKISRSKYRLDMAQRVRPWIVDDEADQVLADVDEQNRTATVDIKQTDGSTIVMHFDLRNGQAVPMCNEDGTLKVERV